MKQKFKVWGITGLILLFLAVLAWAQFYPAERKTITDNKGGTRLTVGTADADTTAWIKKDIATVPSSDPQIFNYFAYLIYGDSIAAADDTCKIQFILQGAIDTTAGDKMVSLRTDTLTGTSPATPDNTPAKFVNAGALAPLPFYRFLITAISTNDSFLVTIKPYWSNTTYSR